MATGPGGIGPGGHIPLSAEWLREQGKRAKAAATGTSAEASETSDTSSLSSAAQKLAITKDEKMLQTMKAELAQLDPDSDSFMEEATGKLIDSVIEEEYGESFKKKAGYENLQEKLMSTILSNDASREALEDFFELLLVTEELNQDDEESFEDGEDEGETEEDEAQDEDLVDQEEEE